MLVVLLLKALVLLAVMSHHRYQHVTKLLSTVEPYVSLWTTINSFYNSYATWMNGPFWKLAPEEVEAETSEAFRWVVVGLSGGPEPITLVLMRTVLFKSTGKLC